jgi:hypothetical protein
MDDDPDDMLRESWIYYVVFWLAVLSLVFLSGCTETTATDQCLRREIFFQCLNSLPAGPVATKYNDWDEVVSQCGTEAAYQSIRKKSQITAQCGVD